ncbi:hypothetical protein TWF594_003013 [Orbilia oligospora]|nr:hypothetical protein TWF594_003013 [Orbilia oligospora]
MGTSTGRVVSRSSAVTALTSTPFGGDHVRSNKTALPAKNDYFLVSHARTYTLTSQPPACLILVRLILILTDINIQEIFLSSYSLNFWACHGLRLLRLQPITQLRLRWFIRIFTRERSRFGYLEASIQGYSLNRQ